MKTKCERPREHQAQTDERVKEKKIQERQEEREKKKRLREIM